MRLRVGVIFNWLDSQGSAFIITLALSNIKLACFLSAAQLIICCPDGRSIKYATTTAANNVVFPCPRGRKQKAEVYCEPGANKLLRICRWKGRSRNASP